MYRKTVIGIYLILLASQYGYAEEGGPLTRPDGSAITFYLDKKGGRHLLVLMQGSDCNSVVHSKVINDRFATVLDDADVLTVEKYGLTRAVPWNGSGDSPACPASYYEHDSPQQRADDYLRVISWLDDQFHYDHITLLGGSEGALVAAMVASRSDAVSAVISLNGGGRFFVDDALHSMELELPPAAFEEAKQGFLAFAASVEAAENMDLVMSGHGFRWWKSMLAADQTELLLSIRAPLLIIQSELDKSVSPKLAYAQAKILMENRNNAEFRTVKGVDHKFHDLSGKDRSSEVVSSVKEWLGSLQLTNETR
ncbi:acyl-CoA thioester hydrolase/BAAT C-terminal domain-containing protein [Alcanivorax sp.]|uniref:alpha/beta fold hydrolase n=1 Tax=Alcanivorax sp. TaxID=1872427 RepID=UPI000C5F9F57|nr:acyl-CoA thioester hydrolase/BAAT C-terminal domain-containing protein [Alcanivorax sp.]MBQ25086.1 alpha/beta hydrolase [Alcanivorax sp.]